jgi:SAM-dependent methyltransferase
MRETDRPSAAHRWAEALDGWAIPDDILYRAPEWPWGFPAALPDPPLEAQDTPARRLALEWLPRGGSVLDVGCGTGAAGLALVPAAESVIGLDESPLMLRRFLALCDERDVAAEAIEGTWPEVAGRAPLADVVVCHHVAYNARDLVAFAVALTGHARHRVVVELAGAHPLTYLAPLWRRFWDLERPSGPTAQDALDVLQEAGIHPMVERSTGPRGPGRDPHDEVATARRRLCLRPDRHDEVAEAQAERPEDDHEVWTFAWPGDA